MHGLQVASSPEKAQESAAAAELRAEHAHVLKERAALKIILGAKMRPLVADVQQALAELPSEHVSSPSLAIWVCVCLHLVDSLLEPCLSLVALPGQQTWQQLLQDP